MFQLPFSPPTCVPFAMPPTQVAPDKDYILIVIQNPNNDSSATI